MSYGYSSYYGVSSSGGKKDSGKTKKKKFKKSDYAYFIIGIIAYPLVLHFFTPNQQIEFGKNLLYAVILGASALLGSIFSHRVFGITDKYASPKEYGKFFLVFMVGFAVVFGWTMHNVENLNPLYIKLVAYTVATAVGVYSSAPKKSPKKKIAVATIVIGYIIYAGVISLIHF